MCSGYDMVWLGKVFMPGHIQLICCPQTKVKCEKRRKADAIQRGCYESELCLLVIMGVFIRTILLKNVS
jgi:hypothetical protein